MWFVKNHRQGTTCNVYVVQKRDLGGSSVDSANFFPFFLSHRNFHRIQVTVLLAPNPMKISFEETGCTKQKIVLSFFL